MKNKKAVGSEVEQKEVAEKTTVESLDAVIVTPKSKKSYKGVTHYIGVEPKGVFTVRQGGVQFDVIFLHDYLKREGINKYAFMKEQYGKLTRINGRGKLNYTMFVCLTSLASIPQYFSDAKGIFEVLINGVWRKCQMINQYQVQHKLKSKTHVQSKLYGGLDGLQHAVLQRYDSTQSISLVVLPKK